MRKKLSGNQIRLLLCLVMVSIFSLSYQFIYQRFEDLSEDYHRNSEIVKEQINQKKEDIAQEETRKSEIKDMTDQCENIISKYPVNITKEDDLLFIENLEEAMKIQIPAANISIADNKVFYATILPIRDENKAEIITSANNQNTSASAASAAASNNDNNTPIVTGAPSKAADTAALSQTVDTSSQAATAGEGTAVFSETKITSADQNSGTSSASATNQAAADKTVADASGQQYMTCLQSQITINFKTTNQKFREIVKYIDDTENASVSNASLSYDSSTGELIAAMTINRYALTGTGKVYEEPDIGNISIGTDDLFGTVTEKKKDHRSGVKTEKKKEHQSGAKTGKKKDGLSGTETGKKKLAK